MADLRTDYKDDLLDTSVNERRKYNMISNDDGTVSFEDVTTYAQVGDSFSASILNQIIINLGGLKFVSLTQAEYDALETKNENTIYFTVE